MLKDSLGLALLNYVAVAHNNHEVTQRANHGEVMANEQVSQLMALL